MFHRVDGTCFHSLEAYILPEIEEYMRNSGVKAFIDYAAYLRERHPNSFKTFTSNFWNGLWNRDIYEMFQ